MSTADFNGPTPPGGGPAFPCHTNPLPGKLANAPQGMTLRQWYAGQSLPAVMEKNHQADIIAHRCLALADAMLAAEQGPSRLALECGRLCREVLDMAKVFETASSGDVAISLAWNSLVTNCLSAGAVMEEGTQSEKPAPDPLLVELLQAIAATRSMDRDRGYEHLVMAVLAFADGKKRDAQ
jgi:hypothetical protein